MFPCSLFFTSVFFLLTCILMYPFSLHLSWYIHCPYPFLGVPCLLLPFCQCTLSPYPSLDVPLLFVLHQHSPSAYPSPDVPSLLTHLVICPFFEFSFSFSDPPPNLPVFHAQFPLFPFFKPITNLPYHSYPSLDAHFALLPFPPSAFPKHISPTNTNNVSLYGLKHSMQVRSWESVYPWGVVA